MDEIFALLQDEYGIISKTIVPAIGGFSAKAYHVKADDDIEYFVKVYDKSLPTTRFFVERIDNYMPVLDWLLKSPFLHSRILTPVPAKNGMYKAETDNEVYTLFLFVHGELPGIQGMTLQQTEELAEILACLHNVSEIVPFETHGLDEDISLTFCNQLSKFLNELNTRNDALFDIVMPHVEILRSAIKQTLHLRDTVRFNCSQLVLCHRDAHGNNVIQGKCLVLADWEDLRLAPVEADLFIYAWHKHSNTLLETYSSARNGYHINQELLYFYTMRRRIEDIWVDIQRLTEESPNKIEIIKLLEYISLGIHEVRALYRDI